DVRAHRCSPCSAAPHAGPRGHLFAWTLPARARGALDRPPNPARAKFRSGYRRTEHARLRTRQCARAGHRIVERGLERGVWSAFARATQLTPAMRRLEILHRTYYNFHGTVRLGPHRLLLRPREGHAVRLEFSRLEIVPTAGIRWV